MKAIFSAYLVLVFLQVFKGWFQLHKAKQSKDV